MATSTGMHIKVDALDPTMPTPPTIEGMPLRYRSPHGTSTKHDGEKRSPQGASATRASGGQCLGSQPTHDLDDVDDRASPEGDELS